MKVFNEMFGWVYQGRPAFADPLAEMFERSIPLGVIIVAASCGIVAILFRRAAVFRVVSAIMAGLSLIGIGFFLIRMVGYYAVSSLYRFDQLTHGISLSWRSSALFFSGVTLAFICVLIGQVLERRRQQAVPVSKESAG